MSNATILPMESHSLPAAAEACEREVLRLLLNYPAQPLPDRQTVASYLLEQVSETPFQAPDCALLLRLCQDEMRCGHLPDARSLCRIENPAVRRLIGELVPRPHELAPDWLQRSTYAPAELPLLQQACDNAILRLNKVNVERELGACLDELQRLDPLELDSYLAQLAIYKQLKVLDSQLAALLGVAPHESAPPPAPAPEPTPGQQAIQELDQLIAEVEAAVQPLRATRRQGHQDVYLLLIDADSKTEVVAQLQATDALMERMRQRYHHYIVQHEQLTKIVGSGPNADMSHPLYVRHQPGKVAMRLRALRLLSDELWVDFRCIVGFMPGAFTLTYFDNCHPAK